MSELEAGGGPYRDRDDALDELERDVIRLEARINIHDERLGIVEQEARRVSYLFVIAALFAALLVLFATAAAPTPASSPVRHETPAEHTETIRQDRALCERACPRTDYVAADCRWLDSGRRACDCTCRVGFSVELRSIEAVEAR